MSVRPTRAGSALALVAGALAVAAGALGGWQAGAVALVGLLVVGAGLGRASRRLVSAGSAALVVGVLVAGLRGAGTDAALVGCGAAVVAWDVGRNAIDLGEHARGASVRTAETVHAVAAALVAAGVAAGGGAVYRSATAGQPTTALVLLAVAALLVVLALWN